MIHKCVTKRTTEGRLYVFFLATEGCGDSRERCVKTAFVSALSSYGGASQSHGTIYTLSLALH